MPCPRPVHVGRGLVQSAPVFRLEVLSARREVNEPWGRGAGEQQPPKLGDLLQLRLMLLQHVVDSDTEDEHIVGLIAARVRGGARAGRGRGASWARAALR